ncbi:hypothetical protein HYH03_001908 [Edaphochlamys debaryana]|uniref:BTB domain-containing protein n=1 Tax=Edaphochlamys debaryana TaxID=47281 RepID=A0A835YER4_9CHLO|nr:hypothetical protein HYH03_001908 [Edaphochlamys debaryana]|eukprot:KAG2500332.1 hypothetical protein HYH03_001908 [Edaphochlamys debaryana]
MASVEMSAPAHTHCKLTLACSDGKRLSAHACALAAASPVLRETLALPLPQPGVLRLQDAGDDWAVALSLLLPKTYPLHLVTWDNVAPLLRLADKYDMAVVRGYAADFMARRSHELSLTQPLGSARNLLTAATLMASYCDARELRPYALALETALDAALSPLGSGSGGAAGAEGGAGAGSSAARAGPDKAAVRGLAQCLERLLRDPQYNACVSPAVQAKVSLALLAHVKAAARRLPSECDRCGRPGVRHTSRLYWCSACSDSFTAA